MDGLVACKVSLVTLALAAALTGCSRMKFADQAVDTVEDDPREDIVLTGIVTDMTSGSQVSRRVLGERAVFKSSQKYLNLSGLRVEMLNNDGILAGETKATTGVVFLQPEGERKKNDIQLGGGVQHRIPNAKDVAKTAALLETSTVLWDNDAERFRGEEAYKLTMSQSGGGEPIVSYGDGFVVTQDLKKWVVPHGAISAGHPEDPRAKAGDLRRELDQRASEEPTGTQAEPGRPGNP